MCKLFQIKSEVGRKDSLNRKLSSVFSFLHLKPSKFWWFNLSFFGCFCIFTLDVTSVHAATPLPNMYPFESQVFLSQENIESEKPVKVVLLPEMLRSVNYDFSNFNLFNRKNEEVDFSLFHVPYAKERNMKIADISSQKDPPENLIDNSLLTSFRFNERQDGKNDSWVILEFESPISINTVKLFPKEKAMIRYLEMKTGLTIESLKTTVSKQGFRRVYDISTPLVKFLKISFWGMSVTLDDIQVMKDDAAMILFTPKQGEGYKILYGGDTDIISYKSRSKKFPEGNFPEVVLSKGVLNPLFPEDSDNDKIPYNEDNCPFVPNHLQRDLDGDRVGDECDNAPSVRNITQSDIDRDGIGDIVDNCKLESNPDQEDLDEDGFGNACDNAHAKESTPEFEMKKKRIQRYIPGFFLISLGIFLFFLLYKQKNNNN